MVAVGARPEAATGGENWNVTLYSRTGCSTPTVYVTALYVRLGVGGHAKRDPNSPAPKSF